MNTDSGFAMAAFPLIQVDAVGLTSPTLPHPAAAAHHPSGVETSPGPHPAHATAPESPSAQASFTIADRNNGFAKADIQAATLATGRTSHDADAGQRVTQRQGNWSRPTPPVPLQPHRAASITPPNTTHRAMRTRSHALTMWG
jgi:hypothetical protein